MVEKEQIVGDAELMEPGDWESVADRKEKRTRSKAGAKATRASGDPGKESERIRKAVITQDHDAFVALMRQGRDYLEDRRSVAERRA